MQVRIVKHAFEIIHLLTDQNPIQITVDAIINRLVSEKSCATREGGSLRRAKGEGDSPVFMLGVVGVRKRHSRCLSFFQPRIVLTLNPNSLPLAAGHERMPPASALPVLSAARLWISHPCAVLTRSEPCGGSVRCVQHV